MKVEWMRQSLLRLNWRHLGRRFQLFDTVGLEQDQIRLLQTFIYSIMGGVVFSNITTGIAMTSYLKELGASDFLYGIMMALPPLANAFQFLVSYWMEKTRKRSGLFIVSGLLQRVVWLPFALVPIFIPLSQPQLRLWISVILAAASACMGPIMNVSFFSLFNDAVPLQIRGRYMSTRSKLATLVGLAVGLLVGVLLDALPVYTNYVVVFTIAAVFGVFDIACYLFVKLPDMASGQPQEGLFRMLKSVLADKKYMRMVLSLTCWFFSVQICAPYFNVFSRENLHLSNLQIILAGQVVYSLALVLLISRWGRALSEYGNKAVLVVSSFLTAFMPMMWGRMGPGMIALVAFSNFYSGATYCAADLSSTNLFMVQAPPKNRSMYFAIYFIFTQMVGLALGSTVGGYLLDNVLNRVDPMGIQLWGVPFTRYNALFVLSTVLRLLTVVLLLSTFDDGAPGETKRLVNAMLQAPVQGFRALRHGIKRRRLRKQYDMQNPSE